MSTEKYLKEAEVTEITRVSASTLRRWRKENKILGWSKFGRSIRYKESDVYQLLEVTGV